MTWRESLMSVLCNTPLYFLRKGFAVSQEHNWKLHFVCLINFKSEKREAGEEINCLELFIIVIM